MWVGCVAKFVCVFVCVCVCLSLCVCVCVCSCLCVLDLIKTPFSPPLQLLKKKLLEAIHTKDFGFV